MRTPDKRETIVIVEYAVSERARETVAEKLERLIMNEVRRRTESQAS